jgi:hypothetical protein
MNYHVSGNKSRFLNGIIIRTLRSRRRNEQGQRSIGTYFLGGLAPVNRLPLKECRYSHRFLLKYRIMATESASMKIQTA